MAGQVAQFAVQAVMAARAQPVRRIMAVPAGWPQVELDGQFQMVNAFPVT